MQTLLRRMPAVDSLYRPELVEERWQRTWEQEGLFEAHPAEDRESYAIAVPPPNVTGALHMGHAFNGTLQDILIRWQRMRGCNTLWQPGYDHAGIATQNVVERELAKEGSTRHDLGREAFVERVWAWLEEYGGIIMGQYRRLGRVARLPARAIHDGRRVRSRRHEASSCISTRGAGSTGTTAW